MSQIRILTIGDVVGPAALEKLSTALSPLKNEYKADFVVVNGENAAPGNGIDVPSAKTLLSSGVDVITTGNHVWQKKDIRDFLCDSEQIIRPANFPPSCPGAGYTVRDCLGWRVLVINVMGTIYMEALESPFAAVDRILERERGRYDIAILDIHAEATSEKAAMAWDLDGKVTAVIGTHTHVQTADARVLPGGTAFLSDVGMVGGHNSILGRDIADVVRKFRTGMPTRLNVTEKNIRLDYAVISYEMTTGHAVSIKAYSEFYTPENN